MGRPDRVTAPLEWGLVAVLSALFVRDGLIPAWTSLNTDFPNYYLAARLFRGGYPLDRLYDWIWFQRQKDHLGLDQAIVGYGPLSPFSALVVAPLAFLPALQAKRCWLVGELALLAATLWLLRDLTRLPWRRLVLVALLTLKPLRTSFLYGQQHMLILFLLTAAAWLYFNRRPAASGVMVAIAAVLKLYPALFAVYFIRKHRWRAVASLCAAGLLLGLLGMALFGVETMRAYLVDVVPRTLRGECNDPYMVIFNSPTALLRRLFVAEPALNPHPLVHAPALYAVLQPLFQALLFVPALWLITPRATTPAAEKLEWGAYVALLLIVSVGSATYHFVVLILATVLAVAYFVDAKRPNAARAAMALHALVCFPHYENLPIPSDPSGWQSLLGFPRLYAMALLWALLAWSLWRARPAPAPLRPFVLLFAALVAAGAVSNLRHLRGQFASYARRVPLGGDTLIAAGPALRGAEIYVTRMADEGYVLDRTGPPLRALLPRGVDLLAPTFVADGSQGWVEVAARASRIARLPPPAVSLLSLQQLPTEIDDAAAPVTSRDGRWLAFIREQRGRGSLWVLDTRAQTSRQVLDSAHDVRDVAFYPAPDDRLVVAAFQGGRSRLLVTRAGIATPATELAVADGSVRYPAVSPDGRRLAYSVRQRGSWQLWVMGLAAGDRRRLTDADCNAVTPRWRADSRTLVYATDCGRAVGQTAICEFETAPDR